MSKSATTWKHVYTVSCPYCRMLAGRACRWTNWYGESMGLGKPHVARIRKAAKRALEEELAEMPDPLGR